MVLVVKNPPANGADMRDAGSIPESGRSPGGGRSLVGYSPWGRKESNRIEVTSLTDTHTRLNLHIVRSAVSQTYLLVRILCDHFKPNSWFVSNLLNQVFQKRGLRIFFQGALNDS